MIKVDNIDNKGIINFYENTQADGQSTATPKQLVQLIGEQSFGEIDFLALKRSGFSILTLDVINLKVLEEFIARLRQSYFIPYWHLSSHAKKEELFFNGFYIKPDWFIKHLNYNEIEIFFLDACDTSYFADSLTGIAKYVISINNKVDSAYAAKMALDFWSSFYQTESVATAFSVTKTKNPENAAHLYLHT